MTSAIDDLITFARGLIPPGATESEEARRLDALAAAAREALDGRSVAHGARLVMDKAKQVAAGIISQHTMLLREGVKELSEAGQLSELAVLSLLDALCQARQEATNGER